MLSPESRTGNLDPSSSPGRDLPPFEDEADNADDAAEEEEGEELFGENLERYVLIVYKLQELGYCACTQHFQRV